jgi:hypothetical protein
MEKINKQLLKRLEIYSYLEDYEFLSLDKGLIRYIVIDASEYMKIQLH